MLYEDILRGFAEAAMPLVDWETAEWTDTGDDAGRAARAMAIAVAMEAAFTATLKARRDAAEQAAKKAREDAARAEAMSSGGPPCIHCGHAAFDHAVDDEERRECMAPDCLCRPYECAAVTP